MKNVGRTPNSDASVITKAWADNQHTAVSVTDGYIDGKVGVHAANTGLVTESYVDNADHARATKVAVDAADALYVPLSQRGVAGGVASVGSSGFVPSGQLPALRTERPSLTIPATTVFLSSEQTISGTTTKTYQAALIEIPDPGYPYLLMPMAFVSGRSTGTLDHSPRVGGTSRGKMAILGQDDTVYGGGIADNSFATAVHPVLPTTINTAPVPVAGATTLRLWLSLHSGASGYVFSPVLFRFFTYLHAAG